MHQRDLPIIVLLLTLGLFACKRSSDAAASASAEPAEVPTTPVATDQAPTPTATTEEPAPASPTPGAKPATTPTTKPTATDAGAVKDASTPPKDAAAPKPTGPSKECVQKCQSLMQGCLTPGVTDGGVPKLPDAVKCQKAFSDCQAVCK